MNLSIVHAFLSYKRLKFLLFFSFNSFPWHFLGISFNRYALLVIPNVHTKFDQNRLIDQFSMEVLTTSLFGKIIEGFMFLILFHQASSPEGHRPQRIRAIEHLD